MENQANNPYQAPQSAVADVPAGGAGEKQELKQLLFSFQGRIPRKPFWLYNIAMYLVIGVVFGIAAAISENLGYIVAVPLYIAMIWIGLATQVKRWHDRGKSGWWVLIGFLPVIGAIWAFVEAGCLRGTIGANEYGGDATDLY